MIKQHRLSSDWPSMPDEDFELLKADIKEKGQVDFITLHEGKVLDGWNRYRACIDLGLTPKTSPYRGKDAEGFVFSKNLHRRHLTASQRAFMVVSRTEKYAPAKSKGETFHPSAQSVSNTEMAEMAGTSERVIQQAKAVATDGGAALKEAVKENEIPIHKAAAIADLPKSEQREAIKEALNPTPKKKAPPKSTDTVSKDKYEALVEKHNELVEEHKELAAEIEGLQAIQSGDHAKELKKLQQMLKAANRARDDALNKTNQMQKQNKYLEGELKKLGWKKK